MKAVSLSLMAKVDGVSEFGHVDPEKGLRARDNRWSQVLAVIVTYIVVFIFLGFL